MPVFWPCRTWRSQMSSIISGVARQKFTKCLHDIATSPPLLTCTFRQWHCNSFSNDSAKCKECKWYQSAFITFFQNQLVLIYHLHSNHFYMVKKIVKIGPVFPEIFVQVSQFFAMSEKVHEIFTRYRGIICAVSACIEVAISHSVLIDGPISAGV